MVTPELKKELEAVIAEWAEKFITQRHAYLIKKNIKASGELTNSLRYQLLQQSVGEVRALTLHFAEHGRFIDMKHAEGGDDQIEGLVEWMKAKMVCLTFVN